MMSTAYVSELMVTLLGEGFMQGGTIAVQPLDCSLCFHLIRPDQLIEDCRMRTVNVSEAKTHLSRLLDAAAAGEEIVIARAGKPLAKLVAYCEDERSREPGYWRGKVHMADDFDVLPDPMAAVFRGDVP